VGVVGVLVVALLAGGGAEGATPPSFHLVFDGRHNDALLHEGSFTTPLPWCSSGTASDVSVQAPDTAVRQFSCAEGGDFTAQVRPLPAEHGGSGSWQIVSGTGPLADLRGKGRFTSVRLGGQGTDPASITFRSTWDGVAALDVVPPTVTLRTSRVQKRKHPVGVYDVSLALSLTDAGGGSVSYVMQVLDGRKPSNVLVFKTGSTATGTLASRFRIKVPTQTRSVRLEIQATDAVGNESAFSKTVRLP
jgi:hypothetical protein